MRSGGVVNGLACGPPWPRAPRPAGAGCCPAAAGACAAGGCCCATTDVHSSAAPAAPRIVDRMVISVPLALADLRLPFTEAPAHKTDRRAPGRGRAAGACYGRRLTYVLLNPLRLLDTVNVPSCCAVTLIHQAGVCAGAAAAPAGPCGGAVSTRARVAASSTLAMNTPALFSSSPAA